MSERRARLWIAAACVIPAVLSAAQTFVSAKLANRPVFWSDLAFAAGDWLVLAPLIAIAFSLGRRFPFRRSIAVHILGALALAVSWASLGMLLGFALDHFPAVPPYARSYLNWIGISLPFGALVYLAALGSAYAYKLFVEAREREAQLANARLSALRMQLHPHFLFNTLNTALVLVRDRNTAAAAQTLELLASLLREVIRTDGPHEIALRRELRFVEQYLAIEQVRFADRLQVEWSIEESARDALVPEFVLQPLVENAIRHGFARRAEASTITIAARIAGAMLELTIADDGAGFDVSQPTGGVGLTNTRERLRVLYGERGSLQITSTPGRGTRALVRIPFRTQSHD